MPCYHSGMSNNNNLHETLETLEINIWHTHVHMGYSIKLPTFAFGAYWILEYKWPWFQDSKVKLTLQKQLHKCTYSMRNLTQIKASSLWFILFMTSNFLSRQSPTILSISDEGSQVSFHGTSQASLSNKMPRIGNIIQSVHNLTQNKKQTKWKYKGNASHTSEW